ncbi:MAG TPA: ABC transporter permease [Vicinamibacterales bacterium]
MAFRTWLKVRALIMRRRLDRDLDDEVRWHLDLLAAEYERSGLPPEAARLAARRAFGNIESMKEAHRDRRTWRWIDEYARDARYALRMLRKHPGFTSVAMLTLALGIGANTALFSVIDALILRKLPVDRPDELVMFAADEGQGPPNTYFSHPLYEDFRDHATTLSGTAIFGDIQRRQIRVGQDAADAEPVKASAVSGNFFSVLGVQAALGRTLTESDDRRADAQPVAVISHEYWVGRFGRSPSIVGQTVTLSGVPVTIVGVAQAGFFGADIGAAPELWWPIQLTPRFDPDLKNDLASRNTEWRRIIGRLRPGRTSAEANAELSVWLDRDTADRFERFRRRLGGVVTDADRAANRFRRSLALQSGATGDTFLRQRYARPLVILMIVVAVVLLIACANVANLLLARAMSRTHEISVRMAIGAGRARLARQFLTESVLLSLGGAALGLLAAIAIDRVLLSFVPGQDSVLRAGIDMRVLLFTAIVAAATGLIFGIVPAVFATGRHAMLALGERAATTGRRHTLFMQHGLLASQVALSVVVLVAAGLFLRSLQNLQRLDLGFDPNRLTVFMLATPGGYVAEQRTSLARGVVDALAQRSDVRGASVSQFGLLSNMNRSLNIQIPGRAAAPGGSVQSFGVFVSPGYFNVTGTRLLRGRDVTPDDAEGSPRVAVINQTMARRFFAGEAIGRRLQLQGPSRPEGEVEIIGVVEDAKYRTPREDALPTFYLPIAQQSTLPSVPFQIEVRTEKAASLPDAVIRGIVRDRDPAAVVTDVQAMNAVVGRMLSQDRLLATLASLFGLLALVVAAVGVYGVRSFAVSRRTNEIGIRMALGASRPAVLTQILGQGVAVSAVGIAIGVLITIPLTRYVATLLFQVSARDGLTFAGVTVALGVVAALASYVPARRATRVDPLVALRYE